MKRMIAMDMDGTLLRADHQLSSLTKRYIRLLHHKYPDILPVLCTGRPKSGILPYLEELGMKAHNAYVISQNGANIFESMTQKRIYDVFLDSTNLQEWLTLGLKFNMGIIGAGVDIYFTPLDKPNSLMLDDIRLINGKLVYRTVETLLQESLYKLLFFESSENLDQLEQQIPQHLRENFYVVRSQPYLLEILPKNINKASGLAELAKCLGLEMSQIMAVGDAMNDYEMLKEVGYAVAMGNACPEIKDIADLVTLSNEEDGVVYAISHWIHEVEKF